MPGPRRARKARARDHLSPPSAKCQALAVSEEVMVNRFAPLREASEAGEMGGGDEEMKPDSECSADSVSISSSWADAVG